MTDLPMTATVAQVAAFLGWTESKLRNRIQSGKGHPPYVKDGRQIMFRRPDVMTWFASLQAVEAVNEPKQPQRRTRTTRGAWPDRQSA